jgi:cytochrome c
MNKTIIYFLCLQFFFLLCSCTEKPKKVLIFSKTEAFRHNSIETGTKSLKQILEMKHIQVVSTEDAAHFTEDSLKQYGTVVFLNTTGDVLNNIQQADFERYIQAGGGFVGVHAATDTEYNWPWYNRLVGAYFNGHPAIQEASLNVIKKEDKCCQHLPETWSFSDEWYNFKSINPDLEILVEIDESSYEGGTNGENHPIVWKHHYDGGRSFYTALGHKEETYSDPFFQQQLFAGIEFTIGNNKLDYSKAKTLRVPEENRFSKRVLDFNLDEPMELDELGDRGILFIERRGALKLYEYASEKVINLDSISVHYANEDGLLGLAVDPNFKQNNWIYLFYSPDIEESVQHVSRFTLVEDQLTEEKILLKIPLIRKCCHSGGSLEFGKDGLLYIGVGDNTNPFESSGFAPIDEREGRQLYDAQRSASNTNDFRGKILRIKPEANGTYSIPPGNLFPDGTENCRPEIFVMGCRNPFRISIDSKTNFLYWGDVGPDAGAPDSLRGPEGMGEFNQAKEAGYYGWPYSRGNNQMYFDYDFTKEKSGNIFDPNQIINNSPNNTGLQSLPAIRESMVWYSYKKSKAFPWLGSGGVNPMSGPIYYSSDFPQSKNALPLYFDRKWFVYEWMRDWIYVIHLDENNQFIQADPFMPNTEFSHPMDMLFSKDGKLYILEYGQKWNSRNLDARLSVIHYNSGNRPPVARFEADKQAGAAPLRVRFSAEKSYDYDKDNIKFKWTYGEHEMKSAGPITEYVFQEPGIYNVALTVTDSKGESSTTNEKILVGNEPPKIEIKLSNPNTTYWKNKNLEYEIMVSDLEDGNTLDGTLDPSNVKVTLNYIPEGKDIIMASIGHQQNVLPKGLALINSTDCKACHAINAKVAGPSFEDVASRYNEEDKQNMMHRIITGSQGIWGENMMAPHPQLELEEVEEMVDYILSLDSEEQVEDNYLSLKGRIDFNEHLDDEVAGRYVLMASYLDQGIPNMDGTSLSAVEKVVFIAPRIELEDAFDLDKDLGIWQNQGRTLVGSIKDGKQIKIPPISFDNLSSVSIGAAFNPDYVYSGEVEIRKGNVNGELLGQGIIQYYDKNKNGFKIFEINLESGNGLDTLVLAFKNPGNTDQFTMNGDWIQLNYNK